MFRLFGKSSSQDKNLSSSTSPQNEESSSALIPSYEMEDLPLRTEPGGLKGFPLDISVIYYHDLQGLLCLGTKNGSLYIYGDGFQFFRPSFMSQNNEIIFLLGISNNRILVVYSDNSLVLFDLPTLQVINFLDSDWLAPLEGNITSIAQEITYTAQNFVYIGTSRGVLRVVECTQTGITPCDFFLLFSELHISQSNEPMELCDIKVSPKDEKYLLLGFRNSDSSESSSSTSSSLYTKKSKKNSDSNPLGAVVLYDLLKLKTKFFHHLTAPPSSLAWYHTGEFFFISTLDGLIHLGNLEKQTLIVCWRSSKEVDIDDLLSDTEDKFDTDSNESDLEQESNEDQTDKSSFDYSKADLFFSKSSKDLPILKIIWLPPQGNSIEGSLMVLISSYSLNSKTVLKNVLVGLSPSAPLSSTSIVFEDKSSFSSLLTTSTSSTVSTSYNTIIRTVYKVPYHHFSSLNHSLIQDFIIVPTANKLKDKSTLYPGLLLLTNASSTSSTCSFTSSTSEQIETNLMLMLTPKTNNVSDWINFEDKLKNPRELYELFPSASTSTASNSSINGANITYFHAFSSISLRESSHISFSKCIMKSADGNILVEENNDSEDEQTESISPLPENTSPSFPPPPPKRRLSSKSVNVLSITSSLIEKSDDDNDSEDELNSESLSNYYTNLLTSSIPSPSSSNNLTNFNDDEEIILAEGVFTEASQYHSSTELKEESEPSLHQRQQDIAVLGQDDGLIKIYGVSLPDFRREVGKGCLWCPLATIECNSSSSTSPISYINVDESNGLMLVGTKNGGVVLFEVYDGQSSGGSFDILSENFLHVKNQMKKLIESEQEASKTKDETLNNFPAKKITDFLTDEKQKIINFSLFSTLNYNRLHKLFHIELKNGDLINNSLLLGQHQLLVLTSQSGKIYYINKFNTKSSKFSIKKNLKLLKLNNIPQYGGLILYLKFAYFKYHKNILPCIYFVFGSGHIIVVNILTMEAIAWANIPKKAEEKQMFFTDNISEFAILNNSGSVLGSPLYNSIAYMNERMKVLLNSTALVSPVSNSSPVNPTNITHIAEEKKSRFSFFRKKEDNPIPVTSPKLQTESNINTSTRISIEDPRFKELNLISYPPEFEPFMLSFNFGNNLVCIPISSFNLVGSNNSNIISSPPSLTPSISSSHPLLNLSSPILKDINATNKKIVASQLFQINNSTEKSTDLPADLYWAFLDQTGWITLFSVSHLSPCGKIKVFETLLPYEEIQLGSQSLVSLLPNGNIFALVDKHPMLLNTLLVYSENLLTSSINYDDMTNMPKTIDVNTNTTLSSVNVEMALQQLISNNNPLVSLASLLPHRAFPLSKPPSSSLQLFYGLKFHLFKRADSSASSMSASSLSAPVAAKKKRASVVMSLTKSELDFNKLMYKPRDQKIRTEYTTFLNGTTSSPSTSTFTPPSRVKTSKGGADAAIGEMNEAKRIMMANAVKLDQISQQGEELQQGAKAFKEMAQSMKNDLQKKNNRWGLF